MKAIGSAGLDTRASLVSLGNEMGEDRSRIVFNEKRIWYRDFYNLMWDFDLKEGLYLVLQFLERKDGVEEPTNSRVITRKILEEEYDLLGYGVL